MMKLIQIKLVVASIMCMVMNSSQCQTDHVADSTESTKSKMNKGNSDCLYELIGPGSELSNFCDDADLNYWSLVFSDDFNGPLLDANKWISGYGWADYAEDALYLPENITFPYPGEMYLNLNTTDTYGLGISYLSPNYPLTLPGNTTPVPNGRIWDCTSGAIRSKRTFKYGKFEIRCWLPGGDYYFPAFWLYGGSSYSEIDIFEFKGQYTSVSTNMHHNQDTDDGVNSSCGGSHNPLFYGKFSNGWHKYKMEWNKWSITYFVDDNPIRVVYRYQSFDDWPITSEQDYLNVYPYIKYNKAFPARPMHIIANLSVVENHGQDVSNGTMKIDYIKAWSKNSELAYLNVENPNSTYMPDENHRYTEPSGGFDQLVDYLHESENSDFADGQGGDFNGDGIDEFVSVRNSDGDIFIHTVYKNNGKFRFKKMGHYTLSSPDSQWAGVTCGDVDNDGEDEIVAVRNSDAKIFIWEVNYVPTTDPYDLEYFLEQKCSYDLAYSLSDWRGIECGDFDNDGTDEFALIRDFDQDVFFMEYDSVQSCIVGISIFSEFGSGSNFADLTAGDFNGDGRDEVAVIRNSDGNMYILQLNNLNQAYIRLAYSAASPSSNWTSITSGQYMGLPNEQIILHRNLDNLVTMVDAINSVTPVAKDYSCTVPVAMGSGYFDAACENFVIMNNFGEYELKSLPASFCAGKHGNESTMVDDANLEIEKDRVIIYPNPTNSSAIIKFAEKLNGEFQLISADGKIIQQDLFNDTDAFVIDLSNNSEGLYHVRIVLDHEIITKRIIKN